MCELGEQYDDQDGSGHDETNGVDHARATHLLSHDWVGLNRQVAGPVPHHAELAQGKRKEYADNVELDQLGDIGVKDEHQDHGNR